MCIRIIIGNEVDNFLPRIVGSRTVGAEGVVIEVAEVLDALLV